MMKKPAVNQRGVALVEFALVLPLLLLLSLITTELGRAFYEYNMLVKAVRDAARYLSTQDPSIQSSDPAKVRMARDLVVYGRPDVTSASQPLLPELSLGNVPDTNIRWALVGSNPAFNTVSIRVSGYRFRPLISEAFGLRLGNSQGLIDFGDITATMRAPS
jgi:hypothetical protein